MMSPNYLLVGHVLCGVAQSTPVIGSYFTSRQTVQLFHYPITLAFQKGKMNVTQFSHY